MSAADREDPGGAERAELVRRVIDLEVRAAFQAQTIEALDGVLRDSPIPVLLLFHGGKVIGNYHGAAPKSKIEQFVKDSLAKHKL